MGPHPAQMINKKQRDGIMENNLRLGTLPKTPNMTSAAYVLATYPQIDPPTLVGVHTNMGLLFSPISPPLPELAHATRRASEGDPGLSRSASRNPTLGSSLRKPFIKRCGKVSPPTFSDGLPGGKGPCGPSRSREQTFPRVRVAPRSPPINIRCVATVGGGGLGDIGSEGASVKAAESTRPCPFADKRPPANDGELESTSAAASPRGGELKD